MNKIVKYLFGNGIPEEYFKRFKLFDDWSDGTIILVNRIILCVVIFILVKKIYGFWREHRKKVIIKGKNYSIQIEYGNILDITGGKRIIHFDECFTTKIGEDPSDIKIESVCGQYLKEHKDINMQYLIDKAGVKIANGTSQFNHQERYEPGTLVPNGDDLLMSFAKLNENGRAYMTYEEFLACLNRLWEQIDIYHGTKDVYVPILGSFITRFDKEFTQQELLDIMINSYRLFPKKVQEPNMIHFVCWPRDDFSINEVLGVN